VLFGEQWRPSIPLFQALCFVGLLWPLHVLNLNVLLALGRSDLYFRLELAKRAISFAALFASVPFGLLAIAWAQVAVGIFCFGINASYAGRLIGHGALRQAKEVAPWIAISTGMGIAVLLIDMNFLSAYSPFIRLPILVLIGAISYGVACMILMRSTFIEMVDIIKLGGAPRQTDDQVQISD